MAEILIKTPVTTNGITPLMENGKQVYTETVVNAYAKKIFESINSKLDPYLQHIITDIKPEVAKEETEKPKK